MGTTMKQYRRLNKVLKTLTGEQKLKLNEYLMSGQGPLPQGANLDTILAYLVTQSPEQIHVLVNQAETSDIPSTVPPVTEDEAPTRGESIMLNLNIKMNGELDPKSVIVISRDITDAEADRLVLQEVSVDNGNFLPISPDRVAGLLKEFADNIVERQNEINSHDI